MSLVEVGTNECVVHVDRAKELIMGLIRGGNNGRIVKPSHAAEEMTRETVSFCRECAILSQIAWEGVRSYCQSLLSRVRHKVL